jgi:large subunit ribosomal protein L7A
MLLSCRDFISMFMDSERRNRMLELLKQRNKVVGIKQTKKAAEMGKLESVLIASDAEPRIVSQLKQFFTEKGINIQMSDSMKQLGKAAGIDVGTAVVGLLKD